MAAPHSISNSPFASYDLVVYFGAGAFSLCLLWNALPVALIFPKPLPDFSAFDAIVGSTAQILFLAFSAYVFGHIVAYLSDQFIEKAVVSVVGYPAKWIGSLSGKDRRLRVRAYVRANRRIAFGSNISLAAIARLIFHVPMLPVYWVCFLWAGMDGFYRSRLPADFMARLDKSLSDKKLNITTKNDGWFRIVEQYVINNQPVATARLYNYVVMYGLLRSLCFTFILLFWLSIIRIVMQICQVNIDDVSRSPMLVMPFISEFIIQFLLYSSVSLMLIFSFGKYYRRYTEEALFSFVLTKD